MRWLTCLQPQSRHLLFVERTWAPRATPSAEPQTKPWWDTAKQMNRSEKIRCKNVFLRETQLTFRGERLGAGGRQRMLMSLGQVTAASGSELNIHTTQEEVLYNHRLGQTSFNHSPAFPLNKSFKSSIVGLFTKALCAAHTLTFKWPASIEFPGREKKTF